jgi:hypothetical protein
MRWLFASLVTVCLVLNTQLCDARMLPIYWSEATTAKVVVDGTGDPIPGVIVVAAWIFTGLEGAPTLTFQITETITDEEGRFHVPGWGPRIVWPPWETFQDLDPQLLLFKPGYGVLVLKNREPTWDINMDAIVRRNKHKEAGGWGDPEYVRRSYWSGRSISLSRKELQWTDLDDVYSALLNFAYHDPPCGWKTLPRLLKATLDAAGKAEMKDSKGRRVDAHGLMLEQLSGPSKPEICGALVDFVEAHS